MLFMLTSVLEEHLLLNLQQSALWYDQLAVVLDEIMQDAVRKWQYAHQDNCQRLGFRKKSLIQIRLGCFPCWIEIISNYTRRYQFLSIMDVGSTPTISTNKKACF